MNFAIIAAVIVLISGIIGININRNPSGFENASPTPSQTVSASEETITPVSTVSPRVPLQKKTIPTATTMPKVPTTTPIPATMKPTPAPIGTNTPKPEVDRDPPQFEYMTGPENGSTVSFNNFCFPMKIKDNVPTGLSVRYSFDNSGPGEWGQNFSPCYQNVSNGFHVFVVQAKDAAGNTSNFVERDFTVQVTPTSTITPLPTL